MKGHRQGVSFGRDTNSGCKKGHAGKTPAIGMGAKNWTKAEKKNCRAKKAEPIGEGMSYTNLNGDQKKRKTGCVIGCTRCAADGGIKGGLYDAKQVREKANKKKDLRNKKKKKKKDREDNVDQRGRVSKM